MTRQTTAKGIILLAVWLVFVTGPAQAEKVITPDNIPGTKKVIAEDIFTLVEKTPNLQIIDARIRMDRKQGYIESSVSLPDLETDCKSLERIISGMHAPVLFYCNGVKCGRSVKSSRIALKCGYDNIYWFRGGFEEWKQKGFPYIK